MSKNRVWIAVVAGFVLSFANLVYAQNVTTSTTNPDAMLDVLKTLETKGVLTHEEYEALKAKVTKDEQKAAEQQQTAVQKAVEEAAPQLKTVAMQDEDTKAMNVVTAMDSGVGFHAGRFDISFSGEINGFYVHDRADNTPVNARQFPDFASFGSCPLCEANTGVQPSSAIRSGLLPGDLSIKISTQEKGWDVAVFFGIWPGIQNNPGPTGTVNGSGGTAALGTPGIDFRQQFATLGRPKFGTLKIGRDLGFFGQEAILNDMTLLCAGSAGVGGLGLTNTHPGSITLGRIGVGYVYTDFLPQISYITPSFHGVQGAFGIFQAYDDIFAGSGARANGVSTTGTLDAHGQPMFQGKLTYTTGNKYKVKAKFWTNFMTQSEQANNGGFTVNIDESTSPKTLAQGASVRATGVDYGTSLGYHGIGLVAYGYNGWGLGTTGLLFGGIDINTNAAGTAGIVKTRGSSGFYIQPSYTWHKAFFGYSYGQSLLSKGDTFDFGLPVRCNSSHIAQFRYAVTKWDNLVAEWTHTRSEAQGQNFYPVSGAAVSTGPTFTDDSVALGTIVFF